MFSPSAPEQAADLGAAGLVLLLSCPVVDLEVTDRRMVRTGSRLVGGLPPLFRFGVTTFDFSKSRETGMHDGLR